MQNLVVLVDDDDDSRIPVGEFLRESGYAVMEAQDAVQALAIMKRSDRTSLLITDIMLPKGMDGYRLAAAFRKQTPHLPVILITGNGGVSGAPGMGFLRKPFRLADLEQKVELAFQGLDPAAHQERSPCDARRRRGYRRSVS